MSFGILIAVFLVAMTTAGQLLLRRAARGGSFRLLALLVAYTFFLSTIVISFFLMHYLELKYFVVVMSLNYVSVMAASAVFFKESLDFPKIIGTSLVVCGAFIFAGAF